MLGGCWSATAGLLRAEIGVAARVCFRPDPTLAVGGLGDISSYHVRAWRSSRTSLTAAIWLNGKPYRGGFDIRREDSGLLVVNHVAIADYLASVVGAEMPRNWEIEALKAQAVAARTYAIQHLRSERDL